MLNRKWFVHKTVFIDKFDIRFVVVVVVVVGLVFAFMRRLLSLY